MGIVRTPSAGRRTRPSVTRSFSTALAVLMGIAKPMPALWPTLDAIMVLIPITSPCEFIRGPPELPGLIAASVWIAIRIDRRIRLDCFINGHAIRLSHRTNRTYDSGGQGPAQAKRVPDRIYFLPDFEIPRITQHRRGQVGCINLNDGQIVRTVRTHYFCAILLAIVRRDFHPLRVGNKVIVGQDVAFFVDNEP